VQGWSITERADEKVFRRGEWVFGFTSSFRMGQLLRYSLKLPEPPQRGLYGWMVTTFVDAVRATLKEGGFASKTNETESGGTFLVGIQGHLFNVESDFQVGHPARGWHAVGCGQAEARGALFASTSTANPRKRVLTALEASAALNGGVSAPFKVVSV
jgi:hypothetical protein